MWAVRRSAGLITFDTDDATDAERVVNADPFQREGLVRTHWLKEWTPE